MVPFPTTVPSVPCVDPVTLPSTSSKSSTRDAQSSLIMVCVAPLSAKIVFSLMSPVSEHFSRTIFISRSGRFDVGCPFSSQFSMYASVVNARNLCKAGFGENFWGE